MDWINVKTQLPEEGQELYYFSPILGIWRGKYTYKPFTHAVWYDENNQPHEEETSEALRNAVSPHVFYCGAGNCDTDEVTHWRPYDEARAAEGLIPLPPMYNPPEMGVLREFHDDGEAEFIRQNQVVIREMQVKS
jgi:hypothetical protein